MKSSGPIIFCILLYLLVSCSTPEEKSDQTTEKEFESPVLLSEPQREYAGIETGTIQKRLIADIIDCTGYIDVPPTNKAMLHAPINGQVLQINAVEGRIVTTNQDLVIIADQDIAELKEAFLDQKLTLAYWEKEFLRKEKLYKQQAISKKEYLNVQNTFEKQKYAYQSLKEQLSFLGINEAELMREGITSRISVRSPINGYVSGVYVNLGSFVDEDKQMVEVINYDHVHLELNVYASDINKIEIGQKVRFQLTGTEYEGWGYVQLIGKKVDEENRSVLIHAHIDKTDQSLIIGSSVVAEILVQADSTYCLPESAIISEGETSYVYRDEADGFVKSEVKTGRSYAGFVEVLNYQELLGKPVVVEGSYYLVD